LRKRGNEVVVLERAPRIDAVGAGITLFANTPRALDRLGVGEAVAARGAAAARSAILTWEGRELTTDGVLKMSRRVDKAAQLADPLGWRIRTAVVRRLPERARRRQLESLVRYEL
jgi:2-polyprenyl-6-methoxyphenol hydroxylase-like FAD-dependent oxidoreductase